MPKVPRLVKWAAKAAPGEKYVLAEDEFEAAHYLQTLGVVMTSKRKTFSLAPGTVNPVWEDACVRLSPLAARFVGAVSRGQFDAVP